MQMAKSKAAGDDRRTSAVKRRSQIKSKPTRTSAKRGSTTTGRSLGVKADRKSPGTVKKKGVKTVAAAAKKTAAKKTAKKPAAKKTAARKTLARKPIARKTTTTTARKTTARKATATKSVAAKSTAAKTTARKPAKKPVKRVVKTVAVRKKAAAKRR